MVKDFASEKFTLSSLYAILRFIRFPISMSSPYFRVVLSPTSSTVSNLELQCARTLSPHCTSYGNLAEYYFGAQKKAHKFCKTCGSSVLTDFKQTESGEEDPPNYILAMNVREHFFAPFTHNSFVFYAESPPTFIFVPGNIRSRAQGQL